MLRCPAPSLTTSADDRETSEGAEPAEDELSRRIRAFVIVKEDNLKTMPGRSVSSKAQRAGTQESRSGRCKQTVWVFGRKLQTVRIITNSTSLMRDQVFLHLILWRGKNPTQTGVCLQRREFDARFRRWDEPTGPFLKLPFVHFSSTQRRSQPDPAPWF